MKQLSLKRKIILGGLGIVILVMVLSTAVVSTVIRNQNRSQRNH